MSTLMFNFDNMETTCTPCKYISNKNEQATKYTLPFHFAFNAMFSAYKHFDDKVMNVDSENIY
jgi:hypothetical protein